MPSAKKDMSTWYLFTLAYRNIRNLEERFGMVAGNSYIRVCAEVMKNS